MALQKQQLPIVMNLGLDQKTDSFLSANLQTAENAVFQKDGKIQKRNGFTATSTALRKRTGNTTLSSITKLATYTSLDVLCAVSNSTTFSTYQSASNYWMGRGEIVSANVTNVANFLAPNSFVKSHSYNGITSFIYAKGSGYSFAVRDDVTNEWLCTDVNLGGANLYTFVFQTIVTATDIHFFYGNYGGTYYVSGAYISIANVRLQASPTVTAYDASFSTYNMYPAGPSTWHAKIIGTVLYTAQIDSGLNLRVMKGPVATAGAFTLGAYAAAGAAGTVSAIYIGEHLAQPIIAWQEAAGIVVMGFTANLATKYNYGAYIASTATSTMLSINSDPVASTTEVTLLYETGTGSGTTDRQVLSQNFAWNGTSIPTLGTNRLVGRGIRLASDTVTIGSYHYGLVRHASNATIAPQQMCFLMRYSHSANLVMATVARDYALVSTLTTPVPMGIGTDAAKLMCGVLSTTGADTTTYSNRLNVFDLTMQYNSENINSSLNVCAGSLWNYSGGDDLRENNFWRFPEIASLTQTAAGGNLTNGTYSVATVFCRKGAGGKITRSAPSVPVSITLTGGGSAQLITANHQNYNIANNPMYDRATSSNSNPYFIEIYRTLVNGNIFYLSQTISNDVSAGYTATTITLADSTISTNPILYTDGGVLDNIIPPSCKYVANFQGRLLLAGLENPNDVWYSKYVNPTENVSFSDSLVFSANDGAGYISAIAPLDDKIILFKNTDIFYTYGNGADNLGLGSYASVQRITSGGIGCIDSRSVIAIPEGLMFQSNLGIYLLDRGMNLSFIGSPVEDYKSYTITSAVSLLDKSEVRFTTSNGIQMVYNHLFKRWSIFTGSNFDNSSSTIADNTQYVADISNNTIYKQDSTTYKDATSTTYSLKIKTGWLKLSGIEGFQRIYRVQFLGNLMTANTLTANAYYDYYNSSVGNTTTFSSATISAVGGAYNWEWHLGQKCEAIQLELYDSENATGTSQAFELTAMELTIGVKSSNNKYASGKKF